MSFAFWILSVSFQAWLCEILSLLLQACTLTCCHQRPQQMLGCIKLTMVKCLKQPRVYLNFGRRHTWASLISAINWTETANGNYTELFHWALHFYPGSIVLPLCKCKFEMFAMVAHETTPWRSRAVLECHHWAPCKTCGSDCRKL